MPATWPPTVPADLLLNAISTPSEDGILRTTVDAGPAKVRPRYMPVASGAIQATLYLTDRQTRTIQQFYSNTLKRVGTFTLPDLIGDESKEWRFLNSPAATLIRGGQPCNLLDLESDPPANSQRLHSVRINLEAVA